MCRPVLRKMVIILVVTVFSCLSFGSIYCPKGDLNDDCQVDIQDVVIFAGQWLDVGGCSGIDCADLDGSDKVQSDDFAILSGNWSKRISPAIITEFMAINSDTLDDEDGDSSDWIELYNQTGSPLDLTGWYLTDDITDKTKWQLPAITLGGDNYLVIFASGKDRRNPAAELHTNFQLDKDGEYLALIMPGGTSVGHEYFPQYPPQKTDISYGLYGNDFKYFGIPTPGLVNCDQTFTGLVADTRFTHNRGFYEVAFDVTITSTTHGATIVYTTDGSFPSLDNGTTVNAPDDSTPPAAVVNIPTTTTLRAAAFKTDYIETNIDTHTYIFIDDVVEQPYLPDGYPSVWYGVFDGVSCMGDYEMDPDVVDNPLYTDRMRESLLSLPTISIVTDVDYLFDETIGIYANPVQDSEQWERPASVEFFTPDGLAEFQIDCGLRIQGGYFRTNIATRKHSFRLLFKDDYGPTKLEFNLFDYDKDAVDHFDTIVLRAGANDGYSWDAAYLTEQYTRDEFGRSLQRDTGNAGSHGTFAHLYVNGLYWGLYNPCERPDGSFSASYYGGDKDTDWDVFKHKYFELSQGTYDMLNQMLSLCQSAASSYNAYQQLQGNNPDGTNNPAYPDLMDVDNYIDYMMVNMWGGNWDWPWNNYWLARKKTPDSTGFKFYCWDIEDIMGSPRSPLDMDKTTGNNTDQVGRYHGYLRQNTEYRMLFADHVHKHFFNGGILTPDSLLERYSNLADWIELSIISESARWGDQHHYPPLTLSEWYNMRDWMLNTYLPQRSAIVLGQMRTAGLYPDLDAPAFKVNGSYQHGGYITSGDTLSITMPGGSAYIEAELVAAGASVYAHVPTDDSLGLTWTQIGFAPDSSWTDGSTGTGVGYEREIGYESLINTDLEAEMFGISSSVFCRQQFTHDGTYLHELNLQMKYDDAFIAYINGTEVYRTSNITNDTPGSATAGSREASVSFYDSFDITSYKYLLNTGTNILAIHGINSSSGSLDMLVMTRLLGLITNPDLDEATIIYTTDGSDPRVPGGTLAPGAVIYTGPFTITDTVHIKTRNLDSSDWSALNEATFAVGPVAESIRITELMYHPADPNTEFIELKNIGQDAINLNLVKFTDGIDFTFGADIVEPNEYILVVENIAQFQNKYGTDINIAGGYSGALNNNGENITLTDAIGTIIHDFEYKDSWYDITDGQGFSLTIKDPYAAEPNLWDDKQGWRPSAAIGGSPGADDTGDVPAIGSIVINETLAHSNYYPNDWIELHNTTGEKINIGGWFLSDDNSDDAATMKYKIATGTSIDPNGYIVFTQDDHFGNTNDPGCIVPFALSENGEAVYLRSGEGNETDGYYLTGYYEEESFGASEAEIAFGRFQKSTGAFNFVAMSENTPGGPNAYPKVGPIVITEIMYHPLISADAEFVELLNISDSTVTLYDSTTSEPWRFVDDEDNLGIEYYFPSPPEELAAIAPDEKILLIKNADIFKAKFGLNSLNGITYYQWLTGNLSNGGEKPELQMPGDEAEGIRYYIRVDRVSYDDEYPWPTEPDDSDQSLTKKADCLDLYGNDPNNWQPATPSPGQ